jgi:uncharacterized protein YecE (DUF72 family)
MNRGRTLVGTSGWSYPHWKGRFYPAGLPVRSQLAYLSGQLDSVEVNGTFYRLARPTTFAGWRAAVGDDFTFAVKGSRYVTHLLKLADVRTPLANFFASGVLLLGRTLGPILWQLPPQLGFDAERARRFLELLPRDLDDAERLARRHDARLSCRAALHAPDGHDCALRHALEVRHASWLDEDALQLLATYDVALVHADTADRHPLSLERTCDFAYVRLHGAEALYASRYTDDQLDRWSAQVDRWSRAGADVFVYFDNDANAFAPRDALRLRARLEHAEQQDLRQRPVDLHP